jgi:hypothetical protein
MSKCFGLSSSRHRFTLWPANPAALRAFIESVGGKILSGAGTPVEIEIPDDEAADRFRALFRPNLICETVPPSEPGKGVRYRRYGERRPVPNGPPMEAAADANVLAMLPAIGPRPLPKLADRARGADPYPIAARVAAQFSP